LRVTRGFFAARRLPRAKPRDRHPERRAGHIVEADLVAEFDRGRVAAMLAADADLELAAHLAAALDADPHQFADALLIDRDEGIGRQNAARGVDAEERGRVVATDAER